jgi:hypothetical protein
MTLRSYVCSKANGRMSPSVVVPLAELVESGPSPYRWWARGELPPTSPKCLDRTAVDRQIAIDVLDSLMAADTTGAFAAGDPLSREFASSSLMQLAHNAELTEVLSSSWHFLIGLRLGAIAQACGRWSMDDLIATFDETSAIIDSLNP